MSCKMLIISYFSLCRCHNFSNPSPSAIKVFIINHFTAPPSSQLFHFADRRGLFRG